MGIGASAGGLNALEAFFAEVQPGSGCAFVVVTHQHPGHTSLLPELIARHTPLPVERVEDGMRVAGNHIYVPPSGVLLSIQGGVFRLGEQPAGATRLPIDHFFRSLAIDQRTAAVAVVLSGTGTDGTEGVRAVKAEAGLTLAQDPATAAYDGMPRSAASTGLVDYVLAPEQMPERIAAWVPGLRRAGPAAPDSFPDGDLQRVFILLRQHTGHDFSLYKPTTVQRRLDRRLRLHQLANLRDYVAFLRAHPDELDLLFQELLIGVTSFFREPEAFDSLAAGPLRELLADKPDGYQVRVWVPGCSTGEEACSLAIVIDECLRESDRSLSVQLFATDINSRAIDFARLGRYPEGIAADVPPQRLVRYFDHDNGHYVISRTIRERIIYAPQDVLRDPPFTRLDLVSCRNLMIYLQPALQRQLLPLFHYALRPDGLLFLGASESVGAVEGLFTPVDARWKIFRRDPGARAVPTLPARQGPARPDPGTQEAGWGGPGNVVQSADKLLLDLFAPSCVLVTQRGEITYVRGRTGAWLEPSEGQPALNVLNMAREGLGPELAVALQRAANEQTTITRPRVRVKTNSEWSRVDVTVRPVAGRTLRGLYLITVTPVPEAEPAPVAGSGTAVGAGDGDAEAPHPLEQELQLTRENLQSTVEELEASNEELKSTNEELQSTNEELQSANEELETSKEELQSLNEELQTVNSELEQKMAEASQISDDMTNLLHSIDIATVFLDRNLRIKRFTPPARTLIRLIDSDVGRPIDDLASRLEYDELVDDAREVLATLVPRQREVMGTAGDWFQVRVRPYRTSDDRLDGVVITFVDVTGTRQAHAVVENLIETAHEPLAVLDDELRILGANAAFLELFGLATTEVRGLPLQAFRIQSPQAGDLAQVLDAIPADRTLENREIRHIYPDGTTRTLHLSARRLEPKRALAGRFIVAFQPVSDRPDQNPE